MQTALFGFCAKKTNVILIVSCVVLSFLSLVPQKEKRKRKKCPWPLGGSVNVLGTKLNFWVVERKSGEGSLMKVESWGVANHEPSLFACAQFRSEKCVSRRQRTHNGFNIHKPKAKETTKSHTRRRGEKTPNQHPSLFLFPSTFKNLFHLSGKRWCKIPKFQRNFQAKNPSREIVGRHLTHFPFSVNQWPRN